MFLNIQVNDSTCQFTCQITQDIEFGSSALSNTMTSKREKITEQKRKKNPLTMCKGKGEVYIKQHLDNFVQQ